MRLKEEHIRRVIDNTKEHIQGILDGKNLVERDPQYWYGYLNALRFVVKMPPDDEITDDEEYD